MAKRADVETKLVGGGIKTPNEARAPFNLSPLVGGDTVYMQQQDYPLDQVRLNKIEQPAPEPAPAPVDEEAPEMEEIRSFISTQKAIAAMQKSMRTAHV